MRTFPIDQDGPASTSRIALAEPSMPLSRQLNCVRAVFPVKFRKRQTEVQRPKPGFFYHSWDTFPPYTIHRFSLLFSPAPGCSGHLVPDQFILSNAKGRVAVVLAIGAGKFAKPA